jgi:hypothetical protein
MRLVDSFTQPSIPSAVITASSLLHQGKVCPAFSSGFQWLYRFPILAVSCCSAAFKEWFKIL